MPNHHRNDWENPQLIAINRQPMHASGLPFADEAAALSRDPRRSPWVLDLDGAWQFHLAPNPDTLPEGFFEEGFDAAGWDMIEVPGNWTMQGYDKPIYLQRADAHPNTPPFVPQDDNPTGLYRRQFEVPAEWLGRQSMKGLPYYGGTFGSARVSEPGRRFVIDLLTQLTDAQLADLFAGARFDKQNGLLQRARPVSEWVRVFKQRRQAISEGPACPAA